MATLLAHHPAAPQAKSDGAAPSRWDRNRRHWDETLDPRNLKAAGESDVARDVALAETVDVRRALGFLEPLEDRLVLDLGGGLALAAILFARRGARIVICDISPNRLKAARRILAEAGVGDRVHLVAGAGEHLPFADAAVDRVFTKSVLIHTRIDETAAECTRVLRPGGKAAFVEPTTDNPFVNAYRVLMAPKIWKDITSYFHRRELHAVRRGVRGTDPRAKLSIERIQFLAFFASAFAFSVPSPRLYRIAESALVRIDDLLFRAVPSLRKRAWFVLIGVRRSAPGGRRRPAGGSPRAPR